MAEIGSAFMRRAEDHPNVREDHVAYIASCPGVKDDKRRFSRRQPCPESRRFLAGAGDAHAEAPEQLAAYYIRMDIIWISCLKPIQFLGDAPSGCVSFQPSAPGRRVSALPG